MGWRLAVPRGEEGRVVEFLVIMVGIVGLVFLVWGIINLE